MCLAVPGKIVSIAGEHLLRTAHVSFAGIIKEVSLAYLPEAEIGDYVMVHVGVAISKIDEDEAAQVFKYLEQLGEISQSEQWGTYEVPR